MSNMDPAKRSVADVSPEAELERLQLERQQLEQRRSRLSERTSATASGSSQFSISALMQPGGPRSPPSTTRIDPRADIGSIHVSSNHARLEEEREALRVALNSRSRSGLFVGIASQRRAVSPPRSSTEEVRARAVEERDRDREKEREKEWAEKLRVSENGKELIRLQIEEHQAQARMLQKKLDDKERKELELTADLQRVEAEAKHNTEMWTQVTQKQQASLLLLHREKGELTMQLDSLKEDNDSLRAKNKNMLLNSNDPEKAAKMAEIEELRMDRARHVVEAEALMKQLIFAQQQLKDSKEELRLSGHELSSLREQVTSTAEDLLRQKHRLTAADSKVVESDRALSHVLAESMTSTRRLENTRTAAAKALSIHNVKRYVLMQLNLWWHMAARSRLSQKHLTRMRNRAVRRCETLHMTAWHTVKQHTCRCRVLINRFALRRNTTTLHRHLAEWLILVRQEIRYDRLGLGKLSRRQDRLSSFFTEWYDLIAINEKLRQWAVRDDHRRAEDSFEIWKGKIKDIYKKREAQKWGLRSFLHITRDELSIFVQAWRQCVSDIRRIKALDRRYFSRCEHVALRIWKDQTALIRRERHIIRSISFRLSFKCVHLAFTSWVHHLISSKSGRRVVRNSIVSCTQIILSNTLNSWVVSARQSHLLRRFANIMRKGCLFYSFQSWSEFAKEFVAQVRSMRKKLHHWILRRSIQEWRAHAVFNKWTDRLMPRLVSKSNSDLLISCFATWSKSVRTQRMVRKVFADQFRRELQVPFHSWVEFKSRNELLALRLSNSLSRWMFKSLREYFNEWQHAAHILRIMRMILSTKQARSDKAIVRSGFRTWCAHVVEIRITRRTLRKGLRKFLARILYLWQCHCDKKHAMTQVLIGKCTRGAFKEWNTAIRHARQVKRVQRKLNVLSTCRALRTWLKIVYCRRSEKRAKRSIIHKSAFKVFRTWAYAVDYSRLGKSYQLALAGKVLLHERQVAKFVFLKWFAQHQTEKDIMTGALLRCKRHTLLTWRRVLVLERIFRSRVYSILPAAVSRQEARLVRCVARAWRSLARCHRILNVKRKCLQQSLINRLLRGVLGTLIRLVILAEGRKQIAGLQARHGQKLLTARSLYHWLVDLKSSREEALVQDRVLEGVKNSESSCFMTTCGNTVRCWSRWAIVRRTYRHKVRIIQKMTRGNILKVFLHRYTYVHRIEKRYRLIVLRSDKSRCTRIMQLSLACIVLFTVNGRIVRSVRARKLRLHKSKLLRLWQQIAGVVNLQVSFEKQRHKTFSFCVQQRYKRGAIRFMHQWVIHLDQRRRWNKFLLRISSKRVSQMLHAWRAAMRFVRLHIRAEQSMERRWLSYRVREWRRNVEIAQEHGNIKVHYVRSFHARAVLREWKKRASGKHYKYELVNRMVKRRYRVVKQRVWIILSGGESNKVVMPLLLRSMLQVVRTIFRLWSQAALLVPGKSVSDTLNRMSHRALLHYVIKQWRKHFSKIKAAMFKIHPQFRLMKSWNLWQNLRHKLRVGYTISKSVSMTVHALYLSCVMRQWLYAVTVPASEAEEAIRIKFGRQLLSKFMAYCKEFVKYIKEVLEAAHANKRRCIIKAVFNEFHGTVIYLKELRAKTAIAIQQYKLQLLADYFYDIRDDVLEGLLIDQSVQEIVRAKTYTTYIFAGFVAFLNLWEEACAFGERANNFRSQQDMVLNSDLLREGFDALHVEWTTVQKSNEIVRQKYSSRNEAAMIARNFNNLCSAVENQQRQYAEADDKISNTYHRSLMQKAFFQLAEDGESEKEKLAMANVHFEIRIKSRAQHLILHSLRYWVTYSRNLEKVALQKHGIYLMKNAFNELMWASQLSVDPGLLKQMQRVRVKKILHFAFRRFISAVKKKTLLYQAHMEVKLNTCKRCIKLHGREWIESFSRRRRRNERLRQIDSRGQSNLCRRSLLAWCAVWLQQVYIGNKLMLVRKRFFNLHIKTPALDRWKRHRQKVNRLLLVYCRIVRSRTVHDATHIIGTWRSYVVNRGRTLRAIQGMMIRSRCNTYRKIIQEWHRVIDKHIKSSINAGGFSLSHQDACCRKHLQQWHRFWVHHQVIKERARTFWVILKALEARRRRDIMAQAFVCFAENFFGARSVACSYYRRTKWQKMTAKHGSLLRSTFFTWRRHWIEGEQLGEALRKVLSQRRTKVDLHHPFWAWVRYVEDRMNIKRETSLVYKTSKILADVLDVYGEPLASDFSIRAERAYTMDDLIKLLRKYHQHHGELKVSAKLQGAAAPRVVSSGPIPYSHFVTNIGKQSGEILHPLGLSPSGASAILPLSLGQNNLIDKSSISDSSNKLDVQATNDYPPGIVIPRRFLLSSSENENIKSKVASQSSASVRRKLDSSRASDL